MLSTACTSAPKKDNNEIKQTDLIYFPSFPDPIVDGELMIKIEGENIVMSRWYFNLIVEYAIKTESAISLIQPPDLIYFPSFPDPIVDGELVIKIEGENIVMPRWYFNLIVEYAIKTESAISLIQPQ